MPRQTTTREFIVRRVRNLQNAVKGSYLECDTDEGTVAIWGSNRNMGNIRAIQQAQTPSLVRARCVSPNRNYPHHIFWVPEWYPIAVVPSETDQPVPPPPTQMAAPIAPLEPIVGMEELSEWRRCINRLVRQLEPECHSDEKLLPRIRRLSWQKCIPRDIAALMVAITEARNMAEYEEKLPVGPQGKAVRNAWEAVRQWARSQGLDPET